MSDISSITPGAVIGYRKDGRPIRLIAGGSAPTSEISFEALRGKTPDELQRYAESIDGRLRSMHQNDDGTLRTKSSADEAAFDYALKVRDAAIALIEENRAIAEVFANHPNATERAFTGPAFDGGGAVRADFPAGDVTRMSDSQVRDAALRVLESRSRELAPRQADRVDGLLRTALSADQRDMDGADLARRLLITESPAYRSAFQQIMTYTHPILTAEEAEAVRAVQRLESRVMGEGSGPAGQYGVPVLIDPSVLLSSGAAAAPILDIARVVPTNTMVWKGVASPPPQFSWDAEGAVVSDDSPTLAQPSINVYTMRGFLPYSLEVGMDYPSFASEMQTLLDAGYQDLMAQTLAVGTGSNQPFGVVTKLDATAASEVRLTTAGQLGAVDVFKAWNALPERFRYNSTWLMNVSTESIIRSFASPTSSSSYFTVDLTADGLSAINGRPVVRSDYVPAFLVGTTTTQNAAVVGSFKNYVVAQRIGLQVEPVPMLFQQQTAGTGIGFPTGQRGFFGFARAGADVAVPNALRLLNQT